MGNRAVITTPEKRIGMYLHWNGGREAMDAFLERTRPAEIVIDQRESAERIAA